MALEVSSYLVILIFTIILILLWKAAAFVFSQSDVPGPKGNWLTGQLFELMQTKDVVRTLHEWTKTYGPIVRYRPKGIFGPANYLLCDAEGLRQILVAKSFNYINPSLRNQFMVDRSVFHVNGKEHSRMRKMINPAFKMNNLKCMFETFDEKAKVLTKFWNDAISTKKSSDGECKLFVQDDFSRLTLDVLGECILGYEFHSIEAGNNEIARAFVDISRSTDANVGDRIFGKLLCYLPFTEGNRHLKEAYQITSKAIKKVIDHKREEQNVVTKTRKDLLDLFLEAVDDETGKGMDEEELLGNLFVFFFAGQDTSSVALSWTFYFLALYPEVQEKLRKEVEETLEEKEVCWEAFDSMKYLAAVVNEALRLRTPAPIYRRQAIQDDNILGYNLPSGSRIIISIYGLHHKPEYWEEPETFNPDRFLEPGKQDNFSNRYMHLPFSAGPRTCVGYRFALMEIKIVLATLIRNFSFSMVPGMSFEGSFDIMYKPSPSLQLLVRKVKK